MKKDSKRTELLDMRLFDLTDQYRVLAEMLESDADNEALKTMLDGLEGKIEEKIDNCLCLRNECLETAQALENEAKRLMERAARAKNDAKRMEQLVEGALNQLGAEKVKTLRFTAWMQSNTASVEVIEESHIPQMFWKQPPPVLDKQFIREQLKANIPVPGAVLKQSKSLRVR